MALLGKVAMVLSFDVVPEAIVEHDNWHSHEHLNERISIPGFRRGSRWVALTGEPNYFVIYEVDNVEVLTSSPYLERLNSPSPWTTKMMKHYRGMRRAFCSVTGSFGPGLGYAALFLRFSPEPGKESVLRERLSKELLPALVERGGIISAHLLEATVRPDLTEEQRLRGRDGGLDWVVLVTGYSVEGIEHLGTQDLSENRLRTLGAIDIINGVYQLRHSLSEREL